MRKYYGLKSAALCFFLLISPFLSLADKTATDTKDNLISVNFRNLDINDALKTISLVSGMNIILDRGLKAQTSVSLKDVSWQTALDNILKTNQLTYRIENNIIRVMSLDTLKKEDETTPLSTKIITLNFAKCADLQQSLSKIISSRGNIQVNTSTNSLIVTDTPDILSKVEEFANKLDVRTPQVMIEALITSIKLDEKNQSGLDFLLSHKFNDEKFFDAGKRTIAQTLSLTDSGIAPYLSLSYGRPIIPSYNLSALLDLLAQDTRVKILANPRVMTMDNQAAQIEILEQVAYKYTSQSTSSTSSTPLTTTQFKDTGIKLYVTPRITKDGYISLSVKTEQSFVGSVSSDGQPSIDSRNVNTNFILKDNETVVIGGLKSKNITTTIDKTPILGDIPLIGKAFRREQKDAVNEELVIFITPKMVGESNLSTPQDKKRLDKATNELTNKGLARKVYDPRQAVIERALDELSLLSYKK